jgi:hypothetical protein
VHTTPYLYLVQAAETEHSVVVGITVESLGAHAPGLWTRGGNAGPARGRQKRPASASVAPPLGVGLTPATRSA